MTKLLNESVINFIKGLSFSNIDDLQPAFAAAGHYHAYSYCSDGSCSGDCVGGCEGTPAGGW